MSWFLSLLLGLLFSLVSAFVTGLIAGLFVVDWYRISSFEGRSGYFVVFIGLLGSVLGFFTGVVCARIVAASADPTFLSAIWLATRALGVTCALGTLLTWLGAPAQPAAHPEAKPPVVPVVPDSGPDEDAQFDALADTAPVTLWLPYTRYGSPPSRVARALAVLERRADLTRELAPLLHATDSATQSDALRVLEQLPTRASAFAADVTAVGRQLADAITRFNESAPDADPRYEVPADIYVRFSAWLVAARALRAGGAREFTTELRAIAEGARIRSDSRAMKDDILPVAEHYLLEWTAGEPESGRDR